MTKEAQNCLLKTLEEPPKFATIILIGSNESAFLTTIKSRCMILHFKPIKDIDIKKYLEENYEMKDITQSMLDSFQGSIGKAVILKDKKEQYVKSAEVLYKSKEEIFEMLDYINIVLLKMAKIDYKYTRCIEIVENTKKRIRQNANYDMCIDYMLFNMWEEIN